LSAAPSIAKLIASASDNMTQANSPV